MAFNKTALGGSVVLAFTCLLACGGSSSSESAKSTGGNGGTTGGSGGTTGGSGGTSGKGGTANGTGGTTGGTAGKGGTGGTTGGTGGTTGGTGGSMPAGGTGGSIVVTTMDCPSFTPCGGNVVGAWRVTAICGDATMTTSTDPTDCASPNETLSIGGDAVYTYAADGTYTVTGNLSIVGDVSINDACAQSIVGTDAAGYCELLTAAVDGGTGGTGGAGAGGTGAAAGAGGASDPNVSLSCMLNADVCNCHVEENNVPVDTTSTYTIMGTQIVSGGTPADFCVQGSTLMMKQTASDGSVSVVTLTRI